jgi:hypothetical protein
LLPQQEHLRCSAAKGKALINKNIRHHSRGHVEHRRRFFYKYSSYTIQLWNRSQDLLFRSHCLCLLINEVEKIEQVQNKGHPFIEA